MGSIMAIFFNFSVFLSTDRLCVKSILEIEIVSGDEAVQDCFADLKKGLGSFPFIQNCFQVSLSNVETLCKFEDPREGWNNHSLNSMAPNSFLFNLGERNPYWCSEMVTFRK